VEILGSAFGKLTPGIAAVLSDVAGLTATKGAGSAPIFLFVQPTQTLYFDGNGAGNGTLDAIKLATMSGVSVMSSADIRVI
jgi:hypothetical protein